MHVLGTVFTKMLYLILSIQKGQLSGCLACHCTQKSLTGISQITDVIKMICQNQIDYLFQWKGNLVYIRWTVSENASEERKRRNKDGFFSFSSEKEMLFTLIPWITWLLSTFIERISVTLESKYSFLTEARSSGQVARGLKTRPNLMDRI